MARVLARARQQQHGRVRGGKIFEQDEAVQLVSVRGGSKLHEADRLPVLPEHGGRVDPRRSAADSLNAHAVHPELR